MHERTPRGTRLKPNNAPFLIVIRFNGLHCEYFSAESDHFFIRMKTNRLKICQSNKKKFDKTKIQVLFLFAILTAVINNELSFKK